MNKNKDEMKLEGLKKKSESRLSSVKVLNQSVLNITGPDNYTNELIESEDYCDTSLEMLAKILQKWKRIKKKLQSL